MFHDEITPAEERAKWHQVYGRFADTVGACIRLFIWVMEEVQRAAREDGRDIHATLNMLMFEFAEPIDGVSILVRSGATKNCSQLLRTALEIQLSLRYVMQKKESYERRCLAYEYYHLREQLSWAQRCDPTSQVGKQLRHELVNDPMANLFDIKGIDISDEIRDLEKRMNAARYKDVRTEVARLTKEKRNHKNWFSLWNGPADVRRLAFSLNLGSLYEVLYRGYSTVGHGAGAFKRMSWKSSELIRFEALRSPSGLSGMCLNACQICNSMTLFLVDALVPHIREAVKKRYVDIQPGLAFVQSVHIN